MAEEGGGHTTGSAGESMRVARRAASLTRGMFVGASVVDGAAGNLKMDRARGRW
jgi:hypothetical protein